MTPPNARGGWAFASASGRVSPLFGVCLIAFTALLIYTAPLVDARPWEVWRGAVAVGGYLRNYLVLPDFAYIPTLFTRLAETFEIAFLATGIAAVLSLPMGFLAARNATPHLVVFHVSRSVLVLLRSLPDVLIALAFVAVLGLGALPGVIAIALSAVGFVARFFADSIEVVDKKAIEGVQFTGASGLQVRLYALLPQSLPNLIATVFYAFDSGLRSATILSIVGAGGIGYDLQIAMRLFEYPRILTILLGIYLSVALADRLSAWVRAKVI